MGRSSMLAVLGAAVLAASPAAAADPPVRIGVSISATGRFAPLAQYLREGYDLWVEDVNRRGGLLGRAVELVVRDDASDPAAARRIYEGLCDGGGVDLVFAPFSSDLTEAALEPTARCGFPLVAAGASADRIWQQGHRHVFGVFVPSSRLTMGFLEMLTLRGGGRLAIFQAAGTFPEEVARGTGLWAGRYGIEVVATLRAGGSTEDAWAPLLAQARAAGADVVVLAGYLEDAVRFTGAVARSGWRPRATYVTVGLGAEEYTRTLGEDADLVFSTSQWEHDARIHPAGEREFYERYRVRHGKAPSYFAATGFAAGQILEEAVRRVGSLDRQRLLESLATMDFESIIGRYGVDRAGMQVRKFDLVVQLQGGRRQVVWPAEHATAEPVLR